MFSKKLKTTSLAKLKEASKKKNFYFDNRARSIVEARYEVLEYVEINVFMAYMEHLNELFSNYANFKFLPSQRIILLDHEPDYYPSLIDVGFSIYNVITLLAYHNIPLENIILFSNRYGCQPEIDKITQEIYNGGTLKVIYTALWADYSDEQTEINPNNLKIEFLYCCLNRNARLHRLVTLAYLNYYKLLDKGIISCHLKTRQNGLFI
jgi:hypothetical protein